MFLGKRSQRAKISVLISEQCRAPGGAGDAGGGWRGKGRGRTGAFLLEKQTPGNYITFANAIYVHTNEAAGER